MICETKNGVLYNRSKHLAVPHLFTTRFGGVSKGVYESLNTSFTVGDDAENVTENIRRAASVICSSEKDVVCSNQTHSTVCRRVGIKDVGTGISREKFSEPADALTTNEKGVVLLVRSADCTPILLYDEKSNAVSAVHSGWKGTLANIIKNTIETMIKEYGTDTAFVHAAVGPCISKESFEVGEDVAKAFADAGYFAFVDYTYKKPHIDLPAICRFQLEKMGVADVDVSNECTMKNNEKYFSHRAQGVKRGLLAAMIKVNGE